MNIKEIIKQEIINALRHNQIDYSGDIIIDIPRERAHGDYSTNIAMQLSRKITKSPLEIAEILSKSINNQYIIKTEVIKPGFINFFVDKKVLFDNINKILNEKDNYGKNKFGNQKKINIEYVSANPTGLLHIGHARGAAYGDSLARIMDFAGYDVTREYYINDAGNQINNLGRSIKERYKACCGIKFNLDDNCYHGEEIIKVAEKIYKEYKDSKLEEDFEYFKSIGIDILLSQIKEDLLEYRVNFDIWTSEKKLYELNKPQNVLSILENKGYTYEQDGAIWLKTSVFGDEKDRVLIKNDHNNTYLLPDIAYHQDKMNRGYDEIVDVLGADHHGYISRLKAAIKMLDEDPSKINVKIVQMVRLIKDNKEYKMSKRTGKTLTMSDLIEEIGIDAVRYFFASRSLDTQMDFNLDLAISQSNDNPVYYVQYAHARICSILREKDIEFEDIPSKYETIKTEEAYNVLSKLYEFEDVIIKSAEKKEVHIITNYLYDLATSFHSFYAKEKVITDNNQYTKERIALIKAVKITLRNALTLIGVEAKERM